MYNLTKNNYHQKPKASNIQTPKEVSEFIFELLKDKILPSRIIEGKKPLILDPCCGKGELLRPWQRPEWVNKPGKPSFAKHRCLTYGIDNDETSTAEFKTDFLKISSWQDLVIRISKKPSLILCNPPFNGYKGKCSAEIWLDKIIELFGKNVPIVLFAPYNFRLPWKSDSKRLGKFLTNKYPPIASIISLPTKGLWEGVVFHSEILIFNIQGLEPHYFFNRQ